MKSKSLIAGSLIVASLALTGNAAMAGTRAAHRYVAPRAPVASYAAPRLPGGLDVGQIIQSMLGGVPPQYQGVIRNAMRTRPGRGAQGAYDGSSDWTPSYDSPSPAIDNSANDEAAAIQSMNDEQCAERVDGGGGATERSRKRRDIADRDQCQQLNVATVQTRCLGFALFPPLSHLDKHQG